MGSRRIATGPSRGAGHALLGPLALTLRDPQVASAECGWDDAHMSDPGTAMREERRFVAAVFADLVGSADLAERLELEELKLVVGDAIARIVGAVEAFGGTVKDLAGDGVLALFGAPVAHEDDPERALLAALRIV